MSSGGCRSVHVYWPVCGVCGDVRVCGKESLFHLTTPLEHIALRVCGCG